MAKSTSSLASSASSQASRDSHESAASSSKSSKFCPWSNPMDRRKRLAANARERKRMHLLNQAYDQLRRRLVDAENKSKYDVLVQAKEYIQALATICETYDKQNQTNEHRRRQQSHPIPPKSSQNQPVELVSPIKQELLVTQTPTPTPTTTTRLYGSSPSSTDNSSRLSAADYSQLDSPLPVSCSSSSWSSPASMPVSPVDQLQITHHHQDTFSSIEQHHHCHQPPMAHHHSIQLHNRLHQSLVATSSSSSSSYRHNQFHHNQAPSYDHNHTHNSPPSMTPSFKECPSFHMPMVNNLF